MKTTYTLKISVESDDKDKAAKLGSLIQKAAKTLDHNDLIKIMEKAVANPSIIKTALKFI